MNEETAWRVAQVFGRGNSSSPFSWVGERERERESVGPRQVNGYDCGAFVIATAVALATAPRRLERQDMCQLLDQQTITRIRLNLHTLLLSPSFS